MTTLAVRPTAKRATLSQVIAFHDYGTRDCMLFFCIAGCDHTPAMCSEGCVTDPDGDCKHGHPSVLVALGMV